MFAIVSVEMCAQNSVSVSLLAVIQGESDLRASIR